MQSANEASLLWSQFVCLIPKQQYLELVSPNNMGKDLSGDSRICGDIMNLLLGYGTPTRESTHGTNLTAASHRILVKAHNYFKVRT